MSEYSFPYDKSKRVIFWVTIHFISCNVWIVLIFWLFMFLYPIYYACVDLVTRYATLNQTVFIWFEMCVWPPWTQTQISCTLLLCGKAAHRLCLASPFVFHAGKKLIPNDWLSDDKMLICGWTRPLNASTHKQTPLNTSRDTLGFFIARLIMLNRSVSFILNFIFYWQYCGFLFLFVL